MSERALFLRGVVTLMEECEQDGLTRAATYWYFRAREEAAFLIGWLA